MTEKLLICCQKYYFMMKNVFETFQIGLFILFFIIFLILLIRIGILNASPALKCGIVWASPALKCGIVWASPALKSGILRASPALKYGILRRHRLFCLAQLGKEPVTLQNAIFKSRWRLRMPHLRAGDAFRMPIIMSKIIKMMINLTRGQLKRFQG